MPAKPKTAQRPEPTTPETAKNPTPPVVAPPVVEQSTCTNTCNPTPVTLEDKIDAVMDAQKEIIRLLGTFPTADSLARLARAGKM